MSNRLTSGWGFFFIAVTLTMVFFCCFSAEAIAQKNITLEEVFEVWKSRQERARTASFSWSGQATYTAGSMPSFGSMQPPGAEGPQPGSAPRATPPKDVTNDYQMTLTLDGGMMRYTSNRPKWFVNYERFIPRTSVSVFDGKNDKYYNSEASDGSQGTGLHKIGYIRKEKYRDVTDYILWPVLFTYRGAHPEMSRFGHEEWTIATQKSFVQDRKCAVLTKSQDNVTETCWVDVERECSILRYDFASDGSLRVRLDITYKQDPAHGWVPFRWTVTRLFTKTAKTAETITAKVSEYQIGVPIPAETFHFDFPPGTMVTDENDGTRHIALEGGLNRTVTSEEFKQGVTYEQLVATAPKEPWWSGFWLPTLIVLLLCGTVAILILRRRVFASKAARGDRGAARDLPS